MKVADGRHGDSLQSRNPKKKKSGEDDENYDYATY